MSERRHLTSDDIDKLFGSVPGPDQSLIVAYEAEDEGDAGHRSRIARIDRQARILWLQDGIEFESTELRLSPNGRHLAIEALVRDDHGYTHFVFRLIDQDDGAPITTLDGPLAKSDRGKRNIHPADDGTLIFEYKPINGYDWLLARYDRRDQALPLWQPAEAPGQEPVPPRKKSFWQALKESFSRPGNTALALSGGSHLKLAADGGLYILENKCGHVSRFDPAGNLLEHRELAGLPVEWLHDFTVDPDGTMYILFQHSRKIGRDDYPHIARIRRGQEPELWIGPHLEDSPSFLPPANSKAITFSADGLLYLDGYDLEDLRAIDLDGKTVWRGPGAEEADREAKRALEENRRYRKKVAEDRYPQGEP